MIYKDPDPTVEILPVALIAALADSVVPAALPAGGMERVRVRLMEKVRADLPPAPMSAALDYTFITLRGSTQPGDGWVEMLPKAHARLLFTDGEAESYMIRLEPGASVPAHDHPADEECLVLEGTLCLGDVCLKAGDFHVARPGMRHGDLRTDTGALLFIRYAKPLAQYLQL